MRQDKLLRIGFPKFALALYWGARVIKKNLRDQFLIYGFTLRVVGILPLYIHIRVAPVNFYDVSSDIWYRHEK